MTSLSSKPIMISTNQSINHLTDKYFPDFETELSNAINFSFTDARKYLEDAIHYSVHSNGKRIRPLICLATNNAFETPSSTAEIIAVAIELIHCYSLIHDDLPAMDNDDFRRGKPTCHKQFGDDIAILSGDVLNTYVFEYLSNQLPNHISHQKALLAIQSLAYACGANGMAGGQVLDLKACSTNANTLNDLQTIHSLKTGALLNMCFELPTRMNTDDESIIQTMIDVGTHFGLLFQIIDDVLDETASFEEIGKSPGKDKAQNKLTYPALLGIDESMKQAKQHTDFAISALTKLTMNTKELELIFHYIYEKGAQSVK